MFARIVLVLLVALVLWAVLARDGGAGGEARTVTVRPGDTLWSIAVEAYGGDPREGVWRLRRENGLVDVTIHPGQRLVVP
ncbi:MAG: LysM peptidoglycan-binding domain-containing protein [Thermoleophilia bacterium]|nr:LysM peptidoglycan-binding domain-containing protein [Gaiellaceae bacterium]MDW8338051.1 LysM peptidoglycan-binding domain-containing protein [Thermoleophilia bacterium]